MTRFSKIYNELVLSQNFADSKRLFLEPLMDIHKAHLLMLIETGIVSADDGRRLGQALLQLDKATIEATRFDGSFEDLFFCVESLLSQACTPEIAGQLHTARSRNDIDVTLYRLRWREELLAIIQAVWELRQTLLEVAQRERATLLPIYTHTQPAQPSTVAHYFLGVVEHLEHDHRRLAAALLQMNQCPLGACAATGTGFPIDRDLTARLLAFEGPTGNTYASIAGADYFLEAVGSVQVLLTMSSRLLHDLLLWSMPDFGFLRIADDLVQPSSIMPQKRNPVAAEHARAITSRALGQAAACFHMLHNTPYGDIVDIEDDLQPLAESLFRDAYRVVALMREVMRTGTFNREEMERRAGRDWITITELADTLVRDYGIPFKKAHAVVSRTIALVEPDSRPALAEALATASREVIGEPLHLKPEQLEEVLDAHRFVSRRRHHGGPALSETDRSLGEAGEQLRQDGEWVNRKLEQLRYYQPALNQRLQAL